MSSIQKVKNGKGIHYKAIYELPHYIDGKRRKTSKTFPVGTPLKTVKEFLAEKELEYSRGTAVSYNQNITFTEMADIYFDTYTNFISPSTVKGYKAVYFNNKPYGIKTYFEGVQIRKIKSRDIQNYINLLSENVSPKSVRNYMVVIKNIFSLAVDESIIQREANPIRGKLILPKKESKAVEAYNMDEFQTLLRLSHEDPNPNIELIINLGLLSGIRRGEMAGLKWENVNFEESYINIVENRISVKDKTYVKTPKTSSGIRKIYIPEKLTNLLRSRFKQYIVNRMRMGRDFVDSGYVISKENGEPYKPQGITNCYVRFLERHSDEIRYLKFHGLRHTYASILIAQGENPKTVQHNLGHADVAMTLQIYSHTYESTQKEAAKRLDESLKKIG